MLRMRYLCTWQEKTPDGCLLDWLCNQTATTYVSGACGVNPKHRAEHSSGYAYIDATRSY
jgi:hypothetical protein